MSLTPEPPPDNVIAIRPDVKLQFTPERAKWCSQNCRQVVVVEKERHLKCQHCGRVIDAFDYVFAIANKEQNLALIEKDLQREITERRKEMERLKQLVQNARQQCKRAGVPVVQIERARLNIEETA